MIRNSFLSKKKNLFISVVIAKTTLIGCSTSFFQQDSPTNNPFHPETATFQSEESVLKNVNNTLIQSSSGLAHNDLSENKPISLEKLQQLARRYNPTLVQAWAHVEAERAQGASGRSLSKSRYRIFR